MNKTIQLHQTTIEANPGDAINGIDDSLVENLWHDLDGRLPRERVRCVVNQVAQEYQNAAVKTFLPIFIYRRALKRLRQELDEMEFVDGCLPDEP
jgi:hypothetical protein